MKYEILPVTAFQQNCSLVWCEATRAAALIDPGGEARRLASAVEARGLRLAHILLTHGHLDHVGAARALAEQFGAPISGPHVDDDFWLEGLPMQSRMFNFPETAAFAPDTWLRDGDHIALGEWRLEVIHCPGHTPGHVVFVETRARLAFVGDVLFKGSIGRTDFPRGNHADLIDSIQRRLLPLGDDIAFVPGHGEMSTFGAERRGNPFLRGARA